MDEGCGVRRDTMKPPGPPMKRRWLAKSEQLQSVGMFCRDLPQRGARGGLAARGVSTLCKPADRRCTRPAEGPDGPRGDRGVTSKRDASRYGRNAFQLVPVQVEIARDMRAVGKVAGDPEVISKLANFGITERRGSLAETRLGRRAKSRSSAAAMPRSAFAVPTTTS